jgi:glucose uptake protein GlcU
MLAVVLDRVITKFALMLPGMQEWNRLARNNLEAASAIGVLVAGVYIGVYAVSKNHLEHKVMGTIHDGLRITLILGTLLYWLFVIPWNMVQVITSL